MAEWIFIGARRYECSACGEGIAEMPCDWASGEPLYNFCPYCGVNIRKMWVETDEPQTETEIAKAIVHKMIDDAVIAEDAYPDLRQKMHDAVDEYEPQTEREVE